jgi:arginase
MTAENSPGTVVRGGGQEARGVGERTAREVGLVSVSMDLGAGRRGVDMGPSAIRIAGLGAALRDLGYRIREVGAVMASGPEMAPEGETRTRYLSEITQVCRQAHDLVSRALEGGCRPLILGGDHALSIGTVSAVADYFRERGRGIGLIWVDAHTDMNTPETTPSGNVHGMVLSVLTGVGPPELLGLGHAVPSVSPENVSIIGARDIDPPERNLVRERGVRVFTMTEIDERGIGVCMDEALGRAGDGTAGYHLSFDLDGIDPMEAPGVGTAVPGGLTYREGHLICEKAARSGNLLSLELVELNPVLDVRNRTASLAVELIASALGKTIL